MSLIKTMCDELDYEKECLKAAVHQAAKYPECGLVYSVNKNGYGQFFKTLKGSSSRKYVKRNDADELRRIVFGHYSKLKAQILNKNIKAIENFLKDYRNFDKESLVASLPTSYQKAIEFVSLSLSAPELIQSENPKHREQLTVEVSNGLMVRSKSEMGIAECLLYYGQRFQY